MAAQRDTKAPIPPSWESLRKPWDAKGLKLDPAFHDVTLVAADGTQVDSWRALLSAQSPVLRGAIEAATDGCSDGSKKPRVPLPVVDGAYLELVNGAVSGDPRVVSRKFDGARATLDTITRMQQTAAFMGIEDYPTLKPTYSTWLHGAGCEALCAGPDLLRDCLCVLMYLGRKSIVQELLQREKRRPDLAEVLHGFLEACNQPPWGCKVTVTDVLTPSMQRSDFIHLGVEFGDDRAWPHWVSTSVHAMTKEERKPLVDALRKRKHSVRWCPKALADLIELMPCKRPRAAKAPRARAAPAAPAAPPAAPAEGPEAAQ